MEVEAGKALGQIVGTQDLPEAALPHHFGVGGVVRGIDKMDLTDQAQQGFVRLGFQFTPEFEGALAEWGVAIVVDG